MSKQRSSTPRLTRLVQLTTVHHREDTRIALRECPELAEIWGLEVVLVVSDGKGNGIQGNVRVIDIGKPVGGRTGRMILGGISAFRTILRHKPEFLHFHDPELIPIGVLCKLMGMRVVYDVHEDLSESIREKQWLPAWLRVYVASIMSLVEKAAAKVFDRVVAATPKISKRFDYNCTVLVQNYPRLSELTVSKPKPYSERSHEFVFVGGLTRRRSAIEMVKAIELVQDSYRAKLVLIGSLKPPELENELQQLRGWFKTEYRGWCNREEVAMQFVKSRAGLVLFHPGPNHMESQPNKMFEYMSASLPVIASDFPLWREIIEGSGAGLLVDPQNAGAISDAMKWILDNPKKAKEMGENGKRAVEKKYNWNIESKKLVAMYHDLIDVGQNTLSQVE